MSSPRLVGGLSSDGNLVAIAVNDEGKLEIDVAVSGGSDASADNQATQIGIEQQIRDRLPPALAGGDRLKVDGSGVTQPISATSLPLPTNAATDAMLQQVRDAIKAQIDVASTIWTDNSGAFYVRRDIVNESAGTISTVFTDPLGATSATTGAGLRPLASTDKDTVTDFYDVITSGTGYSVGNLLASVTVLDVNSGTPSATFVWLNISLNTILATAPVPANIEPSNENVGARQIGNWTVALSSADAANLLNLSNAIGTAITGATMPVGGVGLFGWLSGILNRIPVLGAAAAAAALPVTLATDGVFATFAGLASDAASITGSIHAKLRAIATSLIVGVKTSANSLSFTPASDAIFTTQGTANGIPFNIISSDINTTGNITTADSVSTTATGANNQSIITGNPTANSWVSIAANGFNSFLVQVSGTWTGTLQFETSFDSGTTWYPSSGFSVGTSYTTSLTIANGAFRGNATDATNIRVRATSAITGTANIRIVLSQSIDPVTVRNPLRLFDSVSGVQASIKAANTLPTANDTAIVVSNRESGGFVSSATIQRAANTTPYTANDVYGAAFELQNIVGVASGNILITSIDIIFNISALPSGMGAFILYLYNITPPSAVADNGAFSLPSGDRASVLTPTGILLGNAALAIGGGSVVLSVDNLNLQFKPISTSLFGYLITSNTFTSIANSETATIRARVLVA